MKGENKMKFEKAMVTIIDLEEDIVTQSLVVTCGTANYHTEDECAGGNHKGKYTNCGNPGHRKGQ